MLQCPLCAASTRTLGSPTGSSSTMRQVNGNYSRPLGIASERVERSLAFNQIIQIVKTIVGPVGIVRRFILTFKQVENRKN